MNTVVDAVENARNFWRPLIDTRFNPADAARRATIDSELLVLEEMRVRALCLRNECIAACSLPSEILAAIFALVRDEWPPWRLDVREDFGRRMLYRSGWQVVTHVCSKWRRTAVGVPGLWAKHSYFTETNPQYLPTILARSQDCPLRLQASELGGEDLGSLLAWLSPSVGPRIEHLWLEDSLNVGLFSQLLPQISLHLGNLHTLRLDINEPDTNIELPQAFCQMTQITKLHLKGIHLPWNSAILSTRVTELTLHYEDDLTSHPTCAQFRDLCATMHSLHELTLTNVVPLETTSDIIIQLPQTLRVFRPHSYNVSHASDFLQFLARLRFPDDCTRIALVSQDDEILVPSLDSIAACLGVFGIFNIDDQRGPAELLYTHSGILALRDEQTKLRPRPKYHRYVYPTEIYPDEWKSIGPLAHLGREGSRTDWGNSLLSLHLNGLRVITIYPDIDKVVNISEFFDRLASCAPRVRRVQIWLSECLPLLHALTASNSTNTDFRLFPLLGTIVLYDGIHTGDIDESELLTELTALTALIEARKGKDSPLLEIVVPKNTESWGVWDALRGILLVTFL